MNQKIMSPKPCTALAAWMRITGITRAEFAAKTGISLPTITKAKLGSGRVSPAVSMIISMATGIPAAMVADASSSPEWEFSQHDGKVALVTTDDLSMDGAEWMPSEVDR